MAVTTIAGGTKIEWADFSWNPWWGCERVSPACAHCYADTFAKRVGQKDLWTKTGEHGFRWLSDANWAKPLKWARTAPAVLGRRPRVFCASMADVFEEHPSLEEPRGRLLQLIQDAHQLDWLVLTKRPEFAREWLARAFHPDRYPRNLWLGVSIENSRFTWRADVLREIPAAVRFISAEPLLGSLYPASLAGEEDVEKAPLLDGAFEPNVSASSPKGSSSAASATRKPLDLTGIDWVIVGGESGPKARPFHLEHARELVRACSATCICYPGMCPRDCEPACPYCSSAEPHRPAVFVKQLGAKPVGWTDVAVGEYEERPLKLRDSKGGDITEWPADLRIREFPRSAA